LSSPTATPSGSWPLALVSLAASGLLLLTAYLGYSRFQVPQGANTEHVRVIKGSELVARTGDARVVGNSVSVTGLRQVQEWFHVLLSARLNFRAENYPYLSLNLENLGPVQAVNLIWRSADNPGSLVTTPILVRPSGESLIRLETHPDWQGNVTEIGIHIVAGSESTELTISELRLEPHGWQRLLAASLSEWTAPRRWQPTSINHLTGLSHDSIITPAPAFAAWLLLALLIAWFIRKTRKSGLGLETVIIAMIPWLTIDLLWQGRLHAQLRETRLMFGGKSQHERHLADTDAAIYQYANTLRSEALPAEVTRIHLVRGYQNDYSQDFDRLKLQYYLLPHNLHNLYNSPRWQHVKHGDYILFLNPINVPPYDADKKKLIIDGDQLLDAELVHQHARGQLYRIGAGGDP
jgi:hypothetical protein